MKRVVGGKIMKKIVGDLGRSLLQKQTKVRYGINAKFQVVRDFEYHFTYYIIILIHHKHFLASACPNCIEHSSRIPNEQHMQQILTYIGDKQYYIGIFFKVGFKLLFISWFQCIR